MTAHPPTPPTPLAGNAEEKKDPNPPLIVAALSIWKKHRLHEYRPLHGVWRIFLDYRKTSLRDLKSINVAVKSHLLLLAQIHWRHDRCCLRHLIKDLERKVFKDVVETGIEHLLEIKSPHFSSFRWSRQVPKGNWPLSAEIVDRGELNKHAESKHFSTLMHGCPYDHGQFMFWI